MADDNWKTLRVPVDKYEQAKEQKESQDRTWGQQIVRGENEETGDIPEELVDRIISIERAVSRLED